MRFLGSKSVWPLESMLTLLSVWQQECVSYVASEKSPTCIRIIDLQIFDFIVMWFSDYCEKIICDA